MNGLPVLLRLAGRPVILLGDGPAAEAKRRLLQRAGATVTDNAGADATIAVVAIADEQEAQTAIAGLRARGVLVNAVDRPALCDFTLPAIVERDPVLVAVSTGGASAALAAALRQRLEALLPARLGRLADALHAARAGVRERWPDAGERRRALAAAMAAGAPLDPLGTASGDVVDGWLRDAAARGTDSVVTIRIASNDPDDLTLREARWLASADRVCHAGDIAPAILDRARADAERVPIGTPPGRGLTVVVERSA